MSQSSVSAAVRQPNTTETDMETDVRLPEVIDLDLEPDYGDPLCIDLTDDVEIEHEIVDLTSPFNNNNNNNAPVVVDSASPVLRINTPVSSDDSFDDLPPADFITPTKKSNREEDDFTPGRAVSCPVCLDNYRQIRASKRTLMSTVCGHVFCSECINGAINIQRRCPTCRKKLNKKQIHPLFL
ncbi:E3 ubiquitin-protein ligase RNF4-like isoform X2 [Tubulanus polymorphus]